MSSGGKTDDVSNGTLITSSTAESDQLTNEETTTLNAGTEDTAASLLRAADEIELIADVLAVDIETWGAEYAAALRRKAYALSA